MLQTLSLQFLAGELNDITEQLGNLLEQVSSIKGILLDAQHLKQIERMEFLSSTCLTTLRQIKHIKQIKDDKV